MNNWGYILIGVLILALLAGYQLMVWLDEDDSDYLG